MTRVRILAYVAAGICSALAGVVLAGLTQSGDPTIGAVYLLDAIAAVVIGGTSLAGGVGSIPGTILGAAPEPVSAVLLVSGISTNYQYIVTGVIVIGALLAHSLQSRPWRARPNARASQRTRRGLTVRQRRSYVQPMEVAVPYALVVVALVVAWIRVPGFLSTGHLTALSITAAYLGIIAIGQTLVLLLGGIDLSVPYMINLAAVYLAGFQFEGMNSAKGFVLVLLVGVLVGLVNGLGVALLDISPLVMTLGMNSILQGDVLIYSHGSPKGAASDFVTKLATGDRQRHPVRRDPVDRADRGRHARARVHDVRSQRLQRRLQPPRLRAVRPAGASHDHLAYMLSGLSAAVGGMLLVGYSGQAYLGHGRQLSAARDRGRRDRRHVDLRRQGLVCPDRGGRPADHRDRERPRLERRQPVGSGHPVRRDHPGDGVLQPGRALGPGTRASGRSAAGCGRVGRGWLEARDPS